jgi:hypothetical protein
MVANRTIAGSDADWSNEHNATRDDGNVATATLTGAGDQTSGLAGSNFDFSDLPVNAQILGIHVRVGGYSVDTSANNPILIPVKVIKADNTDGADDNRIEYGLVATLPKTDENLLQTELWGETWTLADIQDPDFGCFVGFTQISAGATVFSVDSLQMRIFYVLVTDWKFPGTVIGNRTVAGGSVNWVNPDNVKADDGNEATVALGAAISFSNGLAATNFDFSEIPNNATIDGIEIRVGDYFDDVNDSRLIPVLLILADDSDGIAVNRHIDLALITTTPQTDGSGDANDRWAEDYVTVADVQDPDFGFFVGAESLGVAANVSVDFLQMRLTYHTRLPTRIVAEGETVAGNQPIFRASDGDYFFLTEGVGVESSMILALKSSDPYVPAPWEQLDAGNQPDHPTDLQFMDCVQDGDLIHIASCDATAQVLYHTFDMDAEVWGVVAEQIDLLTGDPPSAPHCSIAVRSDGDIVVVYRGETGRNMGGDKERVDANVRTGGTWGGPIALDAAGDVHYVSPGIVKDPFTDDMHIFFLRQTATDPDPNTATSDLQARTMEPVSNGLSAVDTDAINTGTASNGAREPPIAWDDDGTVRMLWASFRETTTDERVYCQATVNGSNDVVLDTGYADTAGVEPFVLGNGDSHAFVHDGHGVIHQVFMSATSFDLYYTKSEDQGATWDTPVVFVSDITLRYASASVLLSKAAIVLSVIYADTGGGINNEETMYNEIELYPFEPLFDEEQLSVKTGSR